MENKDVKILLVDDDENYLFMVEQILKKYELNIQTISNPEEALNFLKQNKMDIVLTDFFMPQMTGEEFVKELREFNKKVVVILQTGYSDQKPPLEMLQSMNIQGYFDKTKGLDSLIVLIISAIKTIELNKQIESQKQEIDARTYKDEFLGKFLDSLMGEIKERSFSLVSYSKLQETYAKYIPEEEQGKYNSNIENMNKNINELNDLIETLEIDKPFINTNELKTILDHLFHVTCFTKYIKLNVNVEDNKPLQCDTKTAIYIISDIIDYLINKDEKNININMTSNNDNAIIKVNNKIDTNEIEKLQKIALLDKSIKVEQDNEIVKITL